MVSVGAPFFPWSDSEAVAGIRCTAEVQRCPCLLLRRLTSHWHPSKTRMCSHLLSVFACHLSLLYLRSLISPQSPSVLVSLSTLGIVDCLEVDVAPLACPIQLGRTSSCWFHVMSNSDLGKALISFL